MKDNRIHLGYRMMMSVRTAAGIVALVADRRGECPWCKRESVYLCRDADQSQWIPVEINCDLKEIHDLHRCEMAVAKCDNLRKHLQLDYKLWDENKRKKDAKKKNQKMS